MRKLTSILAVLTPLLLAGCNKRGEDRAPASGASAPTEAGADLTPTSRNRSADAVAPGLQQDAITTSDTTAAPAPPDTGSAPPDTGSAGSAPATPMIIREGTATVRVDSLEPAIAQVQQLAQRLGGYVANSSLQSGAENARQASLELKIPSARWDQALGGLKPIGKLESQQTSSQDVGEEYVDVTARMQNARRLEERLVSLLATRTGKLDDVLAVERELARVREEIERYEGRLRFLRTRAAVSTLTVQLHEPSPVLEPGRSPILDAFRQAWRNFVGFTAGLIASLGWLIPLVLVLAALVWVVLAALVWVLRRLGWRGFGGWRRRGPPASPPPGPPPAAGPPPQANA
ncbi:MAG: DUF4349 domain-containing protein [Longimicrobiaceae bacterium]